MKENNKDELIVVKQLPIIEENLKKLSLEIDEKVKNALALVCNEETIKDVKNVRASLNKEKDELEKQRKQVKQKILEPYDEFEKIYDKYLKDKFDSANKELTKKINDVESDLKDDKKKRIVKYFDEYRLSLNIDFVKFEDANISVDLSTTEKKLKERSKEYLDKLASDLATIKTLSNSDEILIEYKKSKDLNSAITLVNNRHKELEELQKKKEEQTRAQEVNQAPKTKVNFNGGGLYAPKRVQAEPKHLIIDFEATEDELKELVIYLKTKNYKFKQVFLTKRKDGGYDYE